MKKVGILLVCIFMTLILAPNILAQNNSQKVALVMKALSNPFFSKMKQGAQEYAQEHGIDLEIFGVELETDVQQQISLMKNLISRKYGAIVIAPADSRKLIDVCAKALQQGIKIINIDNPLYKPSLQSKKIQIPFVGSNNKEGAFMIGNYVRDKLNNNGKVFIIEGIQGAENADLRKSGFIQGLQKDGNIKIVASKSANWHTDEAFTNVVEMFEKFGPVQAILCANDNMALGALQALEVMDMSDKVLITGYDNIEALRNEMHNKKIQATVEQHPETMGRYGVQLAVQALEGKKIPEHTPTPLDLITYEAMGKKIGFTISGLHSPFFSSLVKVMQKTAKIFGIKLEIKSADDDNAKQLNQIQQFIESDMDLIILNPTNAQTVAPGIELANAANIPVITVDRQATDGKIACHIASDNQAGGQMAARYIESALPGKGKIIELEGIPGTSVAYERSKGFNMVVDANPNLKVIHREVAYFSREKAKAAISKLLKQGLEFDAIFAHNDNMILGAIDALQLQKSPKTHILVGFDGVPEAIKAIRNHELNATIAQSALEMGRVSIKSACEILSGQSVPNVIYVKLKIID